jgi:hypothetical protein
LLLATVIIYGVSAGTIAVYVLARRNCRRTRVAPESILLVVVFAALTIYALFGGADFGAGVWEVNTALQASPKERKLLYSAIGPVWRRITCG